MIDPILQWKNRFIHLSGALQALFHVIFRSGDSLEWYSHWTYVLLGAVGPWLSRTDETSCMELGQNEDMYRCLYLRYLLQLSL